MSPTFCKCDSIVDTVALPVGNSLIITLPGRSVITDSTVSLWLMILSTGIFVKKASYLLATYSSPNSKV